MTVTINVDAGMLPFTGNQTAVEVEGGTIGDCLDHLIARYPGVKPSLLDDSGKVLDYVDVFVNGKSSYPEELARPVRDGDELWILRVFGGG